MEKIVVDVGQLKELAGQIQGGNTERLADFVDMLIDINEAKPIWQHRLNQLVRDIILVSDRLKGAQKARLTGLKEANLYSQATRLRGKLK